MRVGRGSGQPVTRHGSPLPWACSADRPLWSWLTTNNVRQRVKRLFSVPRERGQGVGAVIEPTGAQRDAASVIFNLSEYRVVDAVDVPDGDRRVVTVESTTPPGCPGCGVVATRRHSGRLQRVRDVVVAGLVELWWAKRRWFRDETGCARVTFSEATVQVPAYARSTTRLRAELVAAVVASGRAGSETARAHRVS